MAEPISLPKTILVGGQEVSVEWVSVGITSSRAYEDEAGNVTPGGVPLEMFMPVIPLSMITEETNKDIWRNVRIQNSMTGVFSVATSADLSGQGWDLPTLRLVATDYSLVQSLLERGIDPGLLNNPDVDDYLANQTNLMSQGVNYDLGRVFDMANKIATDPTWATQFRAAGGMGQVEAPKIPEVAYPSPEEIADAENAPKIYTTGEVTEMGITPNPQDIVEANTREEAKALGFSNWVPMGTIDWGKWEKELLNIRDLKSKGYSGPIDENMTARFLSIAPNPRMAGGDVTKGWTTGFSEDKAVPVAAPKPPRPSAEDLEWETLLKQSKNRPEKVARI